ncbi:MAG: hypothetical protein ACOCUA_03025 [archaeon]
MTNDTHDDHDHDHDHDEYTMTDDHDAAESRDERPHTGAGVPKGERPRGRGEPAENGATQAYGLPTPRDEATGELLPDEHTFEWETAGDVLDVTIRLIPPTLEQLERYQDLGDDVGVEQLREVVETHIIQPDIPASDMTVREINCYIYGIIDYGSDGGGSKMDEIRRMVEEREGRSGKN